MNKRNPLSQTSSLAGVIEHRGILGTALGNLGTRIVDGEWSVGDAISKEADLVDELNVSRSVIRETFRILGAKGLIRSRTSDGTRVQPRNQWRLLDPDVMEWRIKAGDTNSLLEDLLKVRIVLEPSVVYTATSCANDEDRVRVEKAWEAKVKTFEDVNTPNSELRRNFIETDLDFHRAFIGAIRSELLDQLFSIIEAALELLLDLQMKAAGYTVEMIGMDKSHELHEEVFNEFIAGNAAGAEIAMRELIKRAIEDAHQGFELLKGNQSG